MPASARKSTANAWPRELAKFPPATLNGAPIPSSRTIFPFKAEARSDPFDGVESNACAIPIMKVNKNAIQQVASADFPTRWGRFRIYGFRAEFGSDGSRRVEEAQSPWATC